MKFSFIFLGLLVGPLAVLAEQEARVLPKREDLVGIWVPEKESMREIQVRTPNRMSPEIELLSRGSFVVLNFPSWWQNVFGHPSGEISAISGAKWELKEGKDAPEILLQDQTFGISMVLSVEGNQSPYFILLRVGGTSDTAPIRFFRKSGELNPPNKAPQPMRPNLRG